MHSAALFLKKKIVFHTVQVFVCHAGESENKTEELEWAFPRVLPSWFDTQTQCWNKV